MAITADGYKDLTVKVEKKGYDYTASVVANKQPVEKTYTAEAEASAHGVVALSAVKDIVYVILYVGSVISFQIGAMNYRLKGTDKK